MNDQSDGNAERNIKVGIFSPDHFVDTVDLRFLPREGDYIQLYSQKQLAWRIEAVVFMTGDYSREWDIVAVIDRSPLQKLSKELYEKTLESIRIPRRARIMSIRADREHFHQPTPAWQRRKALYERVEAGESADTIAETEGTSVKRVRSLISEWRTLLARLRWQADEEIDGKKFDVAELTNLTIA